MFIYVHEVNTSFDRELWHIHTYIYIYMPIYIGIATEERIQNMNYRIVVVERTYIVNVGSHTEFQAIQNPLLGHKDLPLCPCSLTKWIVMWWKQSFPNFNILYEYSKHSVKCAPNNTRHLVKCALFPWNMFDCLTLLPIAMKLFERKKLKSMYGETRNVLGQFIM